MVKGYCYDYKGVSSCLHAPARGCPRLYTVIQSFKSKMASCNVLHITPLHPLPTDVGSPQYSVIDSGGPLSFSNSLERQRFKGRIKNQAEQGYWVLIPVLPLCNLEQAA